MLSLTKLILFLEKYLGVFPVSSSNPNGIKFSFSRSIYCFVILLFCLGFAMKTIHSQYHLFKSGRSLHSTSLTGFFASCTKSTSITIFMVTNITSSLLQCNKMIKFANRISFYNKYFKQSCNKKLLFNVIIFAIIWISVMFVTDRFSFYIRTGFFQNRIEYFLMTLILITFIFRFIYIVMSLKAHFRKINRILESFIPRKGRHYLKNKLILRHTFSASSTQPLTIPMLSDLHWMLCGAIQTTNAIFGCQLLAAMLCIFVHIIITPYFFFLDLLYPSSTGLLNISYLIVQSVWIITHIMELILLVLPCASTTHEANKTASIVCKLLNREMCSETRKQLETFVIQLIHHNAEFSACGLFRLNLPVITSVAGAVTTYLVILIQFQNSDMTTPNGK